MSVIINGVSVEELYRPGVTETAGLRDPTTATKAYYVPNWFDRYKVANGLMGFTSYTGRTPAFVPPTRYPDSPNLYALNLSIRGVGQFFQGTFQCAWTSAIIEVNFGQGNFDISLNNDPGGFNSFDPAQPLIYATQSLDWGAQVIEVPGKALRYAGSGVPLAVGFPKFVGVVTFSLTLHRLPYLPPGPARTIPGSVNLNPIFGCPAKTLRFDGFRTERQFNVDGSILQDATLMFAYRPEAAWDQAFNENGTSGWTTVTYNGNCPLNLVDMSTLIPTSYLG
jgi:hypothetical protein